MSTASNTPRGETLANEAWQQIPLNGMDTFLPLQVCEGRLSKETVDTLFNAANDENKDE